MSDQPDSPDNSAPNPELDDLFDDPALHPPETSAEELAFFEDLKLYDNWHDYGTTATQIFTTRVWSALLADAPMLVEAKVNGEVMAGQLVETILSLNPADPEYRESFTSDPAFRRIKVDTWKFFLQHFPKFLGHAYNMAALSAILAVSLKIWREEPDAELNEFEVVARKRLKAELEKFEKDMKVIIGTRSSGRPPKFESDRLPKIVNDVLDIGETLMGEARGIDAVPGLKQIALYIDGEPTEEALGKRLKRAKYPWTRLKNYLANRPAPADGNSD